MTTCYWFFCLTKHFSKLSCSFLSICIFSKILSSLLVSSLSLNGLNIHRCLIWICSNMKTFFKPFSLLQLKPLSSYLMATKNSYHFNIVSFSLTSNYLSSHVVCILMSICLFVFKIFWSIVDLQYCVNFCCTIKWISYAYTHMLFLRSFPHISHYRVLSRVSYNMQQVLLVIYYT